MNHPVLELSHVSRALTDGPITVQLVRDISFRIMPGEFVAIVGPSGSGKSSLMYLLGLLDQPTEGSLKLDGVETTQANDKQLERMRLEKIGFVFQFHFLLPEFSALDNILLPLRKLGAPEEKAKLHAQELLDYFGIGNMGHKKPGQLSGGERQRVAIARAMANEPLLILADEPTGNLDTKNADLVFKQFERIVREQGKTVITITHDAQLAARAHRQIHIVDGRLVE